MKKTTIWITGDQCSFSNTALSSLSDRKAELTVLMIESVKRGARLKYHKKKLVLIYSIMRHFADELREAGWKVDYYAEHADFRGALSEHIKKHSPEKFLMMEQSEYGANQYLRELLADTPVEFLPHSNFISTAVEFEKLHSSPDSRVTMDRFYRLMRKKTALLMHGQEPLGGQWSYDKENRNPPGKGLEIVPLRQFPPDAVTNSVIKMVDRCFPDHPGTTAGWIYAVTRQDALKAAEDFFENRLELFGPHQDAMLHGQPFMNHSVLSPYINTCLLHPLELCRKAEKKYRDGKAELSSVEGFIRQLIGWREFVWRVYWRLMPEYKQRNSLEAREPLPSFFWTGETDMRCLNDAIGTTIQHGYAHHIVRLMLLGNFALLAGLDPLETNDWFSSMYVDAYDWVMVPNVIGMTLHADGGYVGTKPYAASANYINKMSDYCKGCKFDAKKVVGDDACPFNSLYWDFLKRHETEFSKNPRMAIVMKALRDKSPETLRQISRRVADLRENQFSFKGRADSKSS